MAKSTYSQDTVNSELSQKVPVTTTASGGYTGAVINASGVVDIISEQVSGSATLWRSRVAVSADGAGFSCTDHNSDVSAVACEPTQVLISRGNESLAVTASDIVLSTTRTSLSNASVMTYADVQKMIPNMAIKTVLPTADWTAADGLPLVFVSASDVTAGYTKYAGWFYSEGV
jgi:hypothetical protein